MSDIHYIDPPESPWNHDKLIIHDFEGMSSAEDYNLRGALEIGGISFNFTDKEIDEIMDLLWKIRSRE